MKLASVLVVIFVFVKCTHQESTGWIEPNTSGLQGQLSPREQSALKHITDGIQQFSQRVIPSIDEKSDFGLLCPQVSLYVNLLLAYIGAGGATAEELGEMLGISKIEDELVLLGHIMLTKVLVDPDLSWGVHMFVDRSVQVDREYEKIAMGYFGAAIEPVDFKGTPEDVRKDINSWLEHFTNGTIRDMMSDSTISNRTGLVLVNYFNIKGSWKTKFDKRLTREQPFFLSSTFQVPVQMMNIKGRFGFYHNKDDEEKYLLLDYEGGQFQMLVVLPDRNVSLSDLKLKNKTIDIFEMVNKTVVTDVDVYLPRFKIDMAVDISPVLKKLGVKTMFSESADFSGISDDARLVVSSVLQKVIIEVNEDGSDTTAAVSVNMVDLPKSKNNPVVETFRANRPFQFVILSKYLPIPILQGLYFAPK